MVSCLHCQTPFQATERESEFCCSGCRFVFHLLHKRGLEDFYQYGNNKAPVGAQVFHERELLWLQEWQADAEKEAGEGETIEGTLRVQGISCAGCVWLLEAIFIEHPGAIICRVDASSGRLHLRWKARACDLLAYARDAQRFGYLLGLIEVDATSPNTRPLVRKLGLCAALALNAMLFALPHYLGLTPGEQFSDLFSLISWILATLSILIGGTYFFQRAWGALSRHDIHIDLPISLGLLFAYTGSVVAWQMGEASFAYFDFVSIFTFLMLLGRWMQERAVESNRLRLLGLRLTPSKVRILKNGLEEEISAESLQAGDHFFVARNGTVPVRARMRGNTGVFALNWITGEPAPRQFSSGNIVPSGARSLSATSLELVAMENWSDSQLSRLLAFDTIRPWRNLSLQTWIRFYLYCILTLALAGFSGWLFAGASWLVACQVLISVLVVSCPCAIGVALPLLDDVAAVRLQSFGVYLRDGSLWSRLKRVHTILFDKTGTLTLENLVLANPETLDALTLETQNYLLHLVQDSLHPIAGCLREVLLTRGLTSLESTTVCKHSVKEITGMGLECKSELGRWRLGRSSWAAPDCDASGTVFSLEGVLLAAFTFREEIRPAAKDQIASFIRQGFKIHLLSGDAPSRVEGMAIALGLSKQQGLGGLTPENKAELIKNRWDGEALILGDGANDSLAFDAALCRGTPSVDTGLLEHKADFYLLGRSLAGLGHLFVMSASHRRATRAVVIFALTYNALAVSTALCGWMNPLVAAIIMPLSSLSSITLVFFALRASILFEEKKQIHF